MARKQSALKASQPIAKLLGKLVAFVGKHGHHQSSYEQWAIREGATIVDAAATVPDYLVVGAGRGGRPPAIVAKLQTKHAQMQVLDLTALCRMLIPTPEELYALLQAGFTEKDDADHSYKFWDRFAEMTFRAGIEINLSGANLKNARLFGAKLMHKVRLDNADLGGISGHYAHFGALSNARFDEADLHSMYFSETVEDCSFRNADMSKAWLTGYGRAKDHYRGNFEHANLHEARARNGRFIDCNFTKANLSEAECEGAAFPGSRLTGANLTQVRAARANLDGVDLSRAKLYRADLRNASLRCANLTGADLREAALNDADLSGATVDKADFAGAELQRTRLTNVDVSKAKGFAVPKSRTPGPHLVELAKVAASATKEFVTSAQVDIAPDEFAQLTVSYRIYAGRAATIGAGSRHFPESGHPIDRGDAFSTFEEGMLYLADRWPKATLRLTSIQAKGSKSLRGQKLQELASAAWAETFGIAFSSPEQLQAKQEEHHVAALRERARLVNKIRTHGPEAWNSMDYRLRDCINLRGIDLSGTDLTDISLWSRDLRGANFTGAILTGAKLWCAQLQDAVFTGANLAHCQLEHSTLNGATFRDAKLSNANLINTKLLGVDFTGATLKSANFEKAQFDHATIFPTDFKPPESMIWKGDGPRPGMKKVKAAKAGSIDFETFLQQLNNKVELARIQKAGSMLKAERFQLFAEVKDDTLAGIVKSQSSKDLVYSCRLTSEGAFGCCTQNLRPCGGLRGALCKHLLVLIVGLAKAGQLDSATVDHWIDLSRSKKPAIDDEAMSATFLRYKGAEAGEVDWRPTETIPEDFYSM